MDPQLLLPPGAGLVVEQVQLRDELVHLTVRYEAAGASCPKCGGWSEAFRSSYERGLGDLPISGRQAVIDLRVRRFRCYQSNCPRKTFAEQAPVVAMKLETGAFCVGEADVLDSQNNYLENVGPTEDYDPYR